MTKVSPPRLTLPFSTSVCHSADIDIQNWCEESSGVQGFKKDIPSVETGFCKKTKQNKARQWNVFVCLGCSRFWSF